MLNPFHAILIEDIYSQDELSLIWKEFDSLHRDFIDGNSASFSASNDKKHNVGVMLDTHYSNDRSKSNILQVNRKIFELINQKDSWFFRHFKCNLDYTLVSYYENSDYYKPHTDQATATALTWFYKTPKKFQGGNLHFPEYNIDIEIQNNMCLIFPSKIEHSVDEVSMDDQYLNGNNGRYVMVQFLNQVTEIPN